MGGILPGGAPFWYAANLADVRGLPVGFTGFLIGGTITLLVWVTLPLAVRIGRDRLIGQEPAPEYWIIALIPYIAAGSGLAHLSRVYQSGGRPRLRAAGLAIVSAALAYVVAGIIIFALGLAFLS